MAKAKFQSLSFEFQAASSTVVGLTHDPNNFRANSRGSIDNVRIVYDQWEDLFQELTKQDVETYMKKHELYYQYNSRKLHSWSTWDYEDWKTWGSMLGSMVTRITQHACQNIN